MGFVEAVGVAIVGGGTGALMTLWLARTRRRDETWETCRFWKHELRFLQNKLKFFDRKLLTDKGERDHKSACLALAVLLSSIHKMLEPQSTRICEIESAGDSMPVSAVYHLLCPPMGFTPNELAEFGDALALAHEALTEDVSDALKVLTQRESELRPSKLRSYIRKILRRTKDRRE